MKYDLNSIAHRNGPIYAAFVEYFNNNMGKIARDPKWNSARDCEDNLKLEQLTLPQMVKLVFIMVCEATKSSCAPLWPCNERKSEFIQLPADTLDEVIELNLEWLDEIEKNYLFVNAYNNFKYVFCCL